MHRAQAVPLDSTAGGAARAPLGTESRSIHTADANQLDRTRPAVGQKTFRFRLLRQAQRLLYRRDRGNDQAPVCWCHRTLRPLQEKVYVKRHKDGSGARLSGVMWCGSVWACPVCSNRVTEHRRKELSVGVARAQARGLAAYLLNLTHPHELGHLELAEQLARQDKALQRFKNSRTYKRILGSPAHPGQYGRRGSVRSLEVTHGQNGWHPHTHDLMFAKPGLADDKQAIDELKGAWISALERSGLACSDYAAMWERALVLQDGSKAAEYIAKFGRDSRWGLSSELTRPHAKVGGRRLAGLDAHYTPFQLLAWSMDGDHQAGALFIEYSSAFTGKRMLTWSPGLKRELGIIDLRDEQLIDAPLAEEEESGSLDRRQFATILSRNLTGEFLEFVAICCNDVSCSQSDIDTWVQWAETLPRTHSDLVRQRSPLAAGGWSSFELSTSDI